MAARRGRPVEHRGTLGQRLGRYPGGLQALGAASGVSMATIYRLASARARKIAWEQLGMLAHAIARAEDAVDDDVHEELINLMAEDLAAQMRRLRAIGYRFVESESLRGGAHDPTA